MPSTRLAILAVGVGSALLGWSSAGITAVADDASKTSTPPAVQQPCDHPHDHRGHGGPRL